MLSLAANLSMLFTEVLFLERFDAAAQAGFAGVECLFPYDHPAEDVAHALAASGTELVLFDLPAGDWQAGNRGLACDPGRVGAFNESVELALDYAVALGCRRLNCLAGIVPAGVDAATARHTFITNLARAAKHFAAHGITLLVEPINSVDMPGYLVNRADEAMAVIKAVGMPNVRLQYDVYHAARMRDDMIGTLHRHMPSINHIQIADMPGRHEPGTGTLDFRGLFRMIDASGYEGWVGCEYHPRTTTAAGLNWRESLGVDRYA